MACKGIAISSFVIKVGFSVQGFSVQEEAEDHSS